MAKGLCKLCNKEKSIIYYGICDFCYRNKIIKVYSYYKLKTEYKSIDKIKKDKHRKILRMLLWYNKSFKEIADVLEIPSRTVSWVANKYCFQCDKYGNPKPLEFSGKSKRKNK